MQLQYAMIPSSTEVETGEIALRMIPSVLHGRLFQTTLICQGKALIMPYTPGKLQILPGHDSPAFVSS